MIVNQITEISHCMTQETMTDFVQHEANNGASENMIRRYKGTLKVIYEYLPDDKCITKERLINWRKSMENDGYASITILNYVKYINRYLDYVGCSAIRFNKGRAKDITGMTFGYLTAIKPTGEKKRGDFVWHFQCKCGKEVELPATRVLNGNTTSCGCLQAQMRKEIFAKANKCFGGTNLTQVMKDKVVSDRSISGYVGVTPKRDKWQAYIRYRGKHYSLGCYSDIEEAVKARARAKELVIADAQGLLDFYTELEKSFPQAPYGQKEPRKKFTYQEWIVNNTPASAAKRSDNKSGCPGVNFYKGKWDVKICYKGIRYNLGRYDNLDEAIGARKVAELLLKENPRLFIEKYKNYPHHHI